MSTVSIQPSRLEPGMWAYVGCNNLSHNAIRVRPDHTSSLVHDRAWALLGSGVQITPQAPAGYQQGVVDNFGHRWWHVRTNRNEAVGWTTETGPRSKEDATNVYYLEPYESDREPPSLLGAPQSRLLPGYITYVTKTGDNLRLRKTPDTSSTDNIITTLKYKTFVNLICAGFGGHVSPMVWWQVYVPDNNLTPPRHENKNLGWVSEAETLQNGRTVYYLAKRLSRP